MKKIIGLFVLVLVWGMASYASAAAIMNTLKSKVATQPQVNIQALSPEDKGKYCQSQGFKLLNCSDPYVAGNRCEADPAFVDKCICKSEYNKPCLETQGLKGMGIRCNGMYANCCSRACKNPYATLASCQEQGLEEVHSERDYNDCGDICYVCKDICAQGTPERFCPYGQECEPIEGVRSQQGQRCCTCKCPQGKKECMGYCIEEQECCPSCKEGYRCSDGICLEQ